MCVHSLECRARPFGGNRWAICMCKITLHTDAVHLTIIVDIVEQTVKCEASARQDDSCKLKSTAPLQGVRKLYIEDHFVIKTTNNDSRKL